MRRRNWMLVSLALAVSAQVSYADSTGAFVGVNLGVAEPINGNYRAHVHTGGSASPYVGYMFHPNFGIQAEVQLTGHPPDDENRRADASAAWFTEENDNTYVLGGTVGPRISLPVWEVFSPGFLRGMEVYSTVQGGAFTGLNGRISHTGAGLIVGGGIDFYLTDHFAVGGFARYNRAFTSPRPTKLPDESVVQSYGEQGPHDAEWATVGISLKYDFREPPTKAPACPACVCPECPVRKKIVLRNVYFDFDLTTIRPDAVPILNETVEVLKRENGPFTLILEGHTDSRGTDSYNDDLAKRRSEAVKKYLIEHGVAADKIRTVSFGESKPAATNNTAEGRALNRRVEQKVEN